MKKIVISVVVGLVLVLLIGIVISKTLFKSYYQKENIKIPIPSLTFVKATTPTSLVFNTFSSVENTRAIMSDYVENLLSCYDESYFYDEENNITITKFGVENDFPFNRLFYEYENGNKCENEYVLSENWYEEVMNAATINEALIKKCFPNCTQKNISLELSEVKSVTDVPRVRIENKTNISIDETKNHYKIEVYYTLQKKNYFLTIFKYNDYLAFKVIDDDDHQQNAIYDVEIDIDKKFESVYNGA